MEKCAFSLPKTAKKVIVWITYRAPCRWVVAISRPWAAPGAPPSARRVGALLLAASCAIARAGDRLPTVQRLRPRHHHSFRGSFSAGSTPIFASKYAFFSINFFKIFKKIIFSQANLQNFPKFHGILQKIWEHFGNFQKICKNLQNFTKNLQNFYARRCFEEVGKKGKILVYRIL